MGKYQYIARQPNSDGFIEYSQEENKTWQLLIEAQEKNLPGRACDEYLAGLEQLNLPKDRIPQLDEISAVLLKASGWRLAAVPALIDFDHFFALLADRQFPVATFIRRRCDMAYLQEPDIFHEIFGHCPMLTQPKFAAFTHKYGELGKKANNEERVFLARLYWFTVEFGLLQTSQGLRIYGGGILSSPKETLYAMSGQADIEPLDIINVFRTPYRIDLLQSVYFLIKDIDELFRLSKLDLSDYVRQARQMGLFTPRYAVGS